MLYKAYLNSHPTRKDAVFNILTELWRYTNMKKFIVTVAVLLAALLSAGNDQPTDYTGELLQKGFPQDYAEKLSEVKKLHPSWQFEPLFITDMEKRYTWDHVLYMETDNSPRRSLISGHERYKAYFHAQDTSEYDAGCRRASTAAVAYFLDPRNFLNERDIFQFEKLSFSETATIETLQVALKGTFMANELLENNQSYAGYILQVGRELNVNALFLACRLRQEQGIHGTPLVSGKCGSRLAEYYRNKVQYEGRYQVLTPAEGFEVAELEKLDNLYNCFNIEAAGCGRFTIYFNGMREALKGTPAMAALWGTGSWNTRWKAIYGGALKIAGIYIGNYQNTRYLQKWNVDVRSRTPKGGSKNFWGQYMQNIGAAFSEGKTAYAALLKQGLLDLPREFLVPVYRNMPSDPSPDPANGNCVYYRAYEKTLANANGLK